MSTAELNQVIHSDARFHHLIPRNRLKSNHFNSTSCYEHNRLNNWCNDIDVAAHQTSKAKENHPLVNWIEDVIVSFSPFIFKSAGKIPYDPLRGRGCDSKKKKEKKKKKGVQWIVRKPHNLMYRPLIHLEGALNAQTTHRREMKGFVHLQIPSISSSFFLPSSARISGTSTFWDSPEGSRHRDSFGILLQRLYLGKREERDYCQFSFVFVAVDDGGIVSAVLLTFLDGFFWDSSSFCPAVSKESWKLGEEIRERILALS